MNDHAHATTATDGGPEALPAPGVDGVGGVRALFFTRRGGVSRGDFEGLNCGFGSSDDRGDVAENRGRVADRMGVLRDHLVTVHQTHSPDAVVATTPWAPSDPPRADAAVTRAPGLAVAALAADCAPVLLADPEAGVVAAAHAGWRGALGGVIAGVVGRMVDEGAAPARIVAAIGPCIRQHSYQVGSDLRDAVIADDPAHAILFANDAAADRWRFDLPGLVWRRLEQAGVGGVCDIGLCTYDDPSRFFSYRRGTHVGMRDYGRLISAIARTAS